MDIAASAVANLGTNRLLAFTADDHFADFGAQPKETEMGGVGYISVIKVGHLVGYVHSIDAHRHSFGRTKVDDLPVRHQCLGYQLSVKR